MINFTGKEHALGVGKTLMSTEDITKKNKGIGVECYHYLNDGLWNMKGIKAWAVIFVCTQKKLVNLLTYKKKPWFVFVPVTSSQIFLSPTTTKYASSKYKKNKKNHSSAVLILWIVALVIWNCNIVYQNTMEVLIKKIKIRFTLAEVLKSVHSFVRR